MRRQRCAPPTAEDLWWWEWIGFWTWLGERHIESELPRCPSCDVAPGIVHWKACAIYDTHCRWCYMPNSSGEHEAWCRR